MESLTVPELSDIALNKLFPYMEQLRAEFKSHCKATATEKANDGSELILFNQGNMPLVLQELAGNGFVLAKEEQWGTKLYKNSCLCAMLIPAINSGYKLNFFPRLY